MVHRCLAYVQACLLQGGLEYENSLDHIQAKGPFTWADQDLKGIASLNVLR